MVVGGRQLSKMTAESPCAFSVVPKGWGVFAPSWAPWIDRVRWILSNRALSLTSPPSQFPGAKPEACACVWRSCAPALSVLELQLLFSPLREKQQGDDSRKEVFISTLKLSLNFSWKLKRKKSENKSVVFIKALVQCSSWFFSFGLNLCFSGASVWKKLPKISDF